MPFFQSPPVLPNTFDADRPLREHLERVLPPATVASITEPLSSLGEAAAGSLLELARRAEAELPRHVPFDAWGRRVDRIEVSTAWTELHAEQVRLGLCAIPYEDHLGEHGRIVQHGLVHLYGPSSATYTCPVAMTDAAARVLADVADDEVRDRVLPRLVSRDIERAWTSGQWMTEREGGSDVSRTATVAEQDGSGAWTLTGTKWFTSATTADCALALARPSGGAPGSRGLGLFLVELVDPRDGRSQIGDTIRVNRLKDKLGTKSLPTAELELRGAYATPIGPLDGGVRSISGMLNITRFHNAMNAAAGMRRAADLAVSYARVREASGQRLIDLPLHVQTMAALSVEAEAAFALTLRLAQLTGRAEQGVASGLELRVLRGLTPVAKLLTGKDAVASASEALEAFGGAGYIEDTGLPALLRNAQVLPIWEGTTNVLSLDLLRATVRDGALPALLEDLAARVAEADAPQLQPVVGLLGRATEALRERVAAMATLPVELVSAGMRETALRVGRAYSASLLVEHAVHRLSKEDDDRAALVAQRYVARWFGGPAELPTPQDLVDAARIVNEGHVA